MENLRVGVTMEGVAFSLWPAKLVSLISFYSYYVGPSLDRKSGKPWFIRIELKLQLHVYKPWFLKNNGVWLTSFWQKSMGVWEIAHMVDFLKPWFC